MPVLSENSVIFTGEAPSSRRRPRLVDFLFDDNSDSDEETFRRFQEEHEEEQEELLRFVAETLPEADEESELFRQITEVLRHYQISGHRRGFQ